MARMDDHFGFSADAKIALEQTHQAMDTYFDFLKKSISAFPSGGTEIGDRWKEQSLLNVIAFQELVKRLSTAGSLEEALRIQTAFMHSATKPIGQAGYKLRVGVYENRDERMAVYWGRGAFSSYVIDDAMLAIIEYDSQLEQ